ncbi:MAG: PQQ-binding-like beta-propeller repeat protein, partial [Acidobacteriia bacterium]|nr:PQQ-binding-like beta-propeller repeat protein [Terriglobia bacterium]
MFNSGAMQRACVSVVAVLVLLLCACSGGGGGSTSIAGGVWSKFRHDVNNSGFGNGSVENNDGCLTSVPVDDGPPPLSPISASPAIGLNGTVYVGSEGGTLIAVDPSLNLRWKTTQCDTKGTPTASACSGTLGPFISSPAVYSNSRSGLTTVIAASEAGSVWLFDDTGTTAICTGCFRPTALDDAISGASFVSSPTFMTHPVTLDITGIFIGATVTHSGSTDPSGEIYALNSDGTLKWEYPRRGDPPIGTVTSSLAIGVGNILLFTTDDGNLYALTANGDRKWTFPIGTGSTTGLRLFDPSPLTASLVYATAAGQIIALTPDGGLSWRSPPTPGDDFAASLAIGNQPEITATPLPPSVPTPTPSSGTTPTITP